MSGLRFAPALALAAVACEARMGRDPGPPAYRTVTATRTATGEQDLTAAVKFGAGRFVLLPDASGALYRAHLVYDEKRFAPVMDWRPERRALRVGVTAEYMGGKMDLKEQRLELALGRSVPTDLTLELGAVQADIELGGLSLTTVRIRNGASETAVRFSEPNRAACHTFDLQVGAAQLEATGLGNARCERFDVAGGAGEFTLDFTGAWAADARARLDLKLGVGSVTLRFPESLGVEVEMRKFLVDFRTEGFVKRGDRYVSSGFDAAQPKLYVDASAALGEIRVEWVAPEERH